MKLLSIEDIYRGVKVDEGKWKSLYKDKYVYIKGFYCGGFLYNSHEECLNMETKIDQKIEVKLWRSPIVEKVLYRNKLKCAVLILVCKVTYRPRISLENILRVELLDENGSVIDTEKVGESSMPKELRGKI